MRSGQGAGVELVRLELRPTDIALPDRPTRHVEHTLQRDPRAAICIDAREAGKECGISACGDVELLTGEDARAWADRINAKYLTEAALQHPVMGPAFTEMSNLVIRLRPQRWISWDMETLGEELFGPEMDESLYFHPTLP